MEDAQKILEDAQKIFDGQYFVMRERILSLAADFDRIERSPGGTQVLTGEKATQLRKCLEILLTPTAMRRAEQVQLILSDKDEKLS